LLDAGLVSIAEGLLLPKADADKPHIFLIIELLTVRQVI
jgi:hypothetical protein